MYGQGGFTEGDWLYQAYWIFPARSAPPAIAGSADQCSLTAGKSPHCQNTIPQQGGLTIRNKCVDRGIKCFVLFFV